MDSFETGSSKENCELIPFKLPDRTAQYKYRLCSTENYLALATYKAFSPGKNNESDEWNLQILMKATNAISNVSGKTTLPMQLELRCKNEDLSVITINGSKLKRLDYKILVSS